MKARLDLAQTEIEKAVTEYVERSGWKAGKVRINITRGYDDQREGSVPDTVAAMVDVEPRSGQ